MTVYIRTPYGRFPRYRFAERFPGNWDMQESEVFFPVDVKEVDDEFIISAMLPGLKPEDVEIQISNENVSLKGEFKNEIDEKSTYILQERPSGKFCRTVTLPDVLNASKAEAKMENGILTLSIPKAEEAKPKTIKVTSK
ncbi:MAG: Hsp20/alpha crystallin family protein [Anaerolineae bacterium]|mgnify:FL=1|jgi:HSP20 family protein|nr:Hsp20/alpha crystallin family protein [Anaerolineae bacterium]